MKGYKVFNPDWTCKGFQYEVGKTYEMDEMPEICENGFHFCTELKDCFRYYPFVDNVKIAEVEAIGAISYNDYINMSHHSSKYCTNKIKILREIPYKDLEPTIIEKVSKIRVDCIFGEFNIHTIASKRWNSKDVLINYVVGTEDINGYPHYVITDHYLTYIKIQETQE